MKLGDEEVYLPLGASRFDLHLAHEGGDRPSRSFRSRRSYQRNLSMLFERLDKAGYGAQLKDITIFKTHWRTPNQSCLDTVQFAVEFWCDPSKTASRSVTFGVRSPDEVQKIGDATILGADGLLEYPSVVDDPYTAYGLPRSNAGDAANLSAIAKCLSRKDDVLECDVSLAVRPTVTAHAFVEGERADLKSGMLSAIADAEAGMAAQNDGPYK